MLKVVEGAWKVMLMFLAPGNTARIMRIAENQDLALLIIDFLQGFEVHLAAVTLWGEAEWVINGWLDDDFLIRNLHQHLVGSIDDFFIRHISSCQLTGCIAECFGGNQSTPSLLISFIPSL